MIKSCVIFACVLLLVGSLSAAFVPKPKVTIETDGATAKPLPEIPNPLGLNTQTLAPVDGMAPTAGLPVVGGLPDLPVPELPAVPGGNPVADKTGGFTR